MVKLRLQRYGAKNHPFYRIVASDVSSPRDGRFIEQIGSYDAVKYSDTIVIKEERVKYWLEKGAQPTKTVSNILRKQGLVPATQA